jgi:hypothetical protein
MDENSLVEAAPSTFDIVVSLGKSEIIYFIAYLFIAYYGKNWGKWTKENECDVLPVRGIKLFIVQSIIIKRARLKSNKISALPREFFLIERPHTIRTFHFVVC